MSCSIGRQAGTANQDLWIEKRAAASGANIWTVVEVSQFDGDNAPGDIALAPDGSLIAVGSIRAGDKDSDIWVRKIADSDGAAIWTSSYSGVTDGNGFSIDAGSQVAVAGDGGIYVGGVEGVDFETKEAVILRYGDDGSEQWSVQPKANGNAHFHTVAGIAGGPDGEGYFVIAQSGNVWSFWLDRISSAGDAEWELDQDDFVYAPTDNWLVSGLAIADDQTLTVGGRLSNEEVGQAISWSEAWIANVSLDGVGQCIAAHTWTNTHIIPASTYGYGLAEGPNGAVMVGEVIDGPENHLWVGGFE